MSEIEATEPAISGPVRVDERIPRLTSRLEPGEIAVIEVPDLDRSSALSLLSKRPLAVLNAASSTTGRKTSLGAQVLIDGGIVVIDDLGSDLMTLNEGQTVEIKNNEVHAGGSLVAIGVRRSAEELQEWAADGIGRLRLGVQTFAQGALLTWQQESALILEGLGVPNLPRLEKFKLATVVAPNAGAADELAQMKRFNRDFHPAFIAVAEAADLMTQIGKPADVIVGDPSGVSEKTLRAGSAIVLLERPDGSIPGLERITNYGLNYETIPTAANAVDAAILLADVNGIEQVITVGQRSGIEQFFDQSDAEMTTDFFVNARCRDKVVSSSVVNELYRPGISSWQLVWLILAALVVLGAAIFFTPWGSDVGAQIGYWVSGDFSSSAGSSRLATDITEYTFSAV